MEWFAHIGWPIIASYIALGIVAGFLAGLLGIGGGGMMVPVFVWLFGLQGYPRSHIVHLAVATAMATVMFTALSSVRAHAQRGSVRWDVTFAMAPGMVLGGFFGALFAGRISSFALGMFFAVFVSVMAANMMYDRAPKSGRTIPGRFGLFLVGLLIGTCSALIAIGGAMMTVPFLIWCAVPVIQAVGTSSAVGFPVAVASTIGYVWTGMHVPDLPAGTFGYVDVAAVVCVAAASMTMAPLGASIAHRMPRQLLRRAFAVFLFILALHMVSEIL